MQLKILGEMAVEDRDYTAALAFFTQSLAAARAQGDRYYEGERLFGLGQVYRYLGDSGLARQHLLEALAIAQQVNDEATTAKAQAELNLPNPS
jgi:tetratricopeptide (TPR) repeat protein